MVIYLTSLECIVIFFGFTLFPSDLSELRLAVATRLLAKKTCSRTTSLKKSARFSDVFCISMHFFRFFTVFSMFSLFRSSHGPVGPVGPVGRSVQGTDAVELGHQLVLLRQTGFTWRMYTLVYICIHIYDHVYVCIYVYIICVYVYVCMYNNPYIYIPYIYIDIYIYRDIYIYISACVCYSYYMLLCYVITRYNHSHLFVTEIHFKKIR